MYQTATEINSTGQIYFQTFLNLIKCKYPNWELVKNCFKLERLGGKKILEIKPIHTYVY
jgi:hypothetical protein